MLTDVHPFGEGITLDHEFVRPTEVAAEGGVMQVGNVVAAGEGVMEVGGGVAADGGGWR